MAEFKTSQGVTIRILDDAFRDKTPEELERVAEEARRTAWRIAEAKAMRARAAETEAGKPVNATSSVSLAADSFPSRGSQAGG